MIPLIRKNLLFHSSRYSSASSSLQVRTFLFRFPSLGFSSPPPPQQLREDKVRVSVWWDVDTCGVPSRVSFSKVAPSIMWALRTHGIKSPIDIQACGNLSQLSEIDQELLLLTGIDLHHIPAHLFIISGDSDPQFVTTVSQFRMNNYNILLACPAKTSFALCYTATIMWQWPSMLRGDFTRKHFMNPPRWYGDLKVPLENLFSTAGEHTSSQSMEIHKVDEVSHSQYSSPVDNSLVEKTRHDGSAETSSGSSTLFSRISSWLTFWKSSAKSDDLIAHQDVVIHSRKPKLFEDSKLSEVNQTPSHFEEPKSSEFQQNVSHSGMPELFSTDSFWHDMESFVFTPRGSCLLSQSRSREDLTHKLQKHGPPALRCLTKNDILQLAELLIAEKKWLEESPSQAFPFRLTQAVQKSSLVL